MHEVFTMLYQLVEVRERVATIKKGTLIKDLVWHLTDNSATTQKVVLAVGAVFV